MIFIKNIIIIGTPRSGKTTLTNKLLKKFNFTAIYADALRDVFIERLDCRTLDIVKKVQRVCPKLINQLFIQMQFDTKRSGIGIIIDDTDLEVEECDVMYGSDDNIIYCLGTSRITYREMKRALNKYDTVDDWSKYWKDNSLSSLCDFCINTSKENAAKCKKYSRIKYVDTSYNREDVLNKIVDEIGTLI